MFEGIFSQKTILRFQINQSASLLIATETTLWLPQPVGLAWVGLNFQFEER